MAKDTVEVYRRVDGWRWRRQASNGEIVGAATESYADKDKAVANAMRNGATEDNVEWEFENIDGAAPPRDINVGDEAEGAESQG